MTLPFSYDDDETYARWERIQLQTGLWVLVPVEICATVTERFSEPIIPNEVILEG